MSLPSFRSFFPDVARWLPTRWRQEYRLIVDNATGVPVGILNQNANGADGIWGLTPISAAQATAPTAAMLADLGATYQLNQDPFTRYRSDGTQFVSLDGTGGPVVVPAGVNAVWFSPLTVIEGAPLKIYGGVRVIQ